MSNDKVLYEGKIALHGWTLGSWGPGARKIVVSSENIFIEGLPEIPLDRVNECSKKWALVTPYVDLQFLNDQGVRDKLSLFVPTFIGELTGKQVERICAEITRAQMKQRGDIVPVELLKESGLQQTEHFHRTSKPMIAGILILVAGGISLAWLGLPFIIGFLWLGNATAVISLILFAIIIIPMVVIIPLLIIGGVFALKRRGWQLTFASSIAAIVVFPPLGIPAIILITQSKKEFA